jgi:hypothetical protein
MHESTATAELDDYRGKADKPKTDKEWQLYWQKEKAASDKRVKKYQKQGNGVVRRFLDERQASDDNDGQGSSDRLNLFHTNISTMQSMLFGSTPKIDVSREHHDPDDDIARVASTLFQRILEADVYSSGDDLSTTLRAALQDRLLPGMGIARVLYEVETEKEKALNPETVTAEDTLKVTYESAKCDYVHWQDFSWGWARTWAEVPWVGYKSYLTQTEAGKRFTPEKVKSLDYKNQVPSGDANNDIETEAEQKDNTLKVAIWEFWHRAEKKVFWYAEGAEAILDEKDDPLKLEGFFPSPKPLIANPTTTLFMPKADFIMAQDLYNEIDELQSRITTITEAVKVVGVYDKGAGESVGRMLKEGQENNLIPVDNWAMFSEKGGIQGSVDWFPVQDIVGVLQTLSQVRDQTIDLLYQVTGMSDLMRGGDTQQYTSDGTNQLKAKFGSIRVQALQDEFARFASDLEAIKAEVISKHFDIESIAKQSNAQFMPEADRDKIGPALQLMKSQDIAWRVDIKPESVAMVDYAQLKQERTEFLTAMATYIQSASSAAQAAPGSMPILLEMLKWGMAGFKGSDYLEGMMDQAIDMAKKAPPEQKDDGKAQAEQQKQQAEMQKLQMKHQQDMELSQAKHGQEMQKMQEDFQTSVQEIRAKSEADVKKITDDLQADLTVIRAKLGADLQVEEAQSTFAVAETEVEHTFNTVEEQQQHQNALVQAAKQATQRDGDTS